MSGGQGCVFRRSLSVPVASCVECTAFRSLRARRGPSRTRVSVRAAKFELLKYSTWNKGREERGSSPPREPAEQFVLLMNPISDLQPFVFLFSLSEECQVGTHNQQLFNYIPLPPFVLHLLQQDSTTRICKSTKASGQGNAYKVSSHCSPFGLIHRLCQ